MKKLFLTGASGFLGNIIRPILERSYDVHTIGLTDDDDIKINLAYEIPLVNFRYDIVLHACGKAHVVPKNEAEEQAFYDVNYHGTVNVCKALEKVGAPNALIFISTVAVYGCEYGENISEDYPLNGSSPYAKSKIMAEEYLIEWCKSHGVVLSILRPSLLAGGNAPGNLGAMVHAIKKGYYMNIAGGKVKKSIMMAEDIARLVPLLVEKGGIYNVCDNHHPSYSELSMSIVRQLGKRKPWNLPYPMAFCMAKVGDMLGSKAPINTYKLKKMTRSLTFSNDKARRELGWEPLDVLENYKI